MLQSLQKWAMDSGLQDEMDVLMTYIVYFLHHYLCLYTRMTDSEHNTITGYHMWSLEIL